jgi:hypothetical protein
MLITTKFQNLNKHIYIPIEVISHSRATKRNVSNKSFLIGILAVTEFKNDDMKLLFY